MARSRAVAALSLPVRGGIRLPSIQYLAIALTTAIVLVGPGVLIARRFQALWSSISPLERLLPSLLLGAGVLDVIYVLSLLLRPTVSFALGAWFGATAALVVAAGLRELIARRARRSSEETARGSDRARWELPAAWSPSPSGRALAGTTALAALLLMLREGGSLGSVHDSLDWVAFVRRMLFEDRIDLLSPGYADDASLTPDPRRGAFHLAGALVCRMLGVTPDHFWRAFPVLAAPLAILSLFALTRRLLRSERAAGLAALLFCFVGYFNADHYLNNLGYASRFGWVVSWGGLWALAILNDAADRRTWRAATALAVVAAPILLGIHILSAVQYLVALGALSIAWGIVCRRDATQSAAARGTVLALPLFAAVALAPFLAYQLARSYSTANPLFDHAQGLLYLAGPWAVLGTSHLSEWFGVPGLLGVIVALGSLRLARGDRAAAYLSVSTLATLLVVVNPLAVALIERAGAHSLLFRVMWTAPFCAALGWWLDRAWRGGGASTRRAAIAASVLVVLALGLHVSHARRFWGGLKSQARIYEENEPLHRALAFLERSIAEPSVVAADPVASYQIPAYTRHHVVAPYEQHSSPADGEAIARMQDVHAILAPWYPLDRTWERIKARNVQLILLDHTYPRSMKTYFSFIGPLTFDGERAKFGSRPDLFEALYDSARVTIFRVRRDREPAQAGADSTHWQAPVDSLLRPPFRTRRAPSPSRETAARELGIEALALPAVGGLEPIGIATRDLGSVRRGEPMRVPTWWRRTGAPITLPVEVYVRVEWDSLAEGVGSRPARLLREWLHDETLRFGRFHQPLEAYHPAYLWDLDVAYEDDYVIWTPPDSRPGHYRVRLRPMVNPYAPLTRLGDLLRNDDALSGPVVAHVRITE